MSRRIRLQPQGLDLLIKKLGGGAVIRDELRRAFTRSALIVESAAKKLAPVDRGRYRASITHRIDAALFPQWAEVGSSATYARAIEEGRPPGTMPPVKALEKWAKRKNLNAWAVAKSIEKHGIKPNPVLSTALEESQQAIEGEFTNALERMRDQWGR